MGYVKVTLFPTPTGEGLTAEAVLGHVNVAGQVKLKPEVFATRALTNASLAPDKALRNGVMGGCPDEGAEGKLPDAVSPATNAFSDTSVVTLVPMSAPDPPRMLVELVFVPETVVVTIRAKKASVPPPELSGAVFGKFEDCVKPVRRAFCEESATMDKPTSSLLPPKYEK